MNKSDRRVLLMLLTLAAVALCGIYYTGNQEVVQPEAEANYEDTLTVAERGSGKHRKGAEEYYNVPQKKKERFPFDPNTADSTALLRLGLQPWQVRNIYRYRAAGGVYSSKEDFARLRGLTVKEYRELEPYIRISSDYLPASTLFEGKRHTTDTGNHNAGGNTNTAYAQRIKNPRKISEGETVDLNISDTTTLKTVPGIGSYYAWRIQEYGRRLGGYVSVSQLDEIDNLPDEVKKYFSVSQPHPQQLAINRLTLNELRRHPYISYYQAKAITDYRRLYGHISSLTQLRLLPEFPPEAIGRLEPYISYE